MKKFLAASMLAAVVAATGFCADDIGVAQTQSGTGVIPAQQGSTPKVNTMVAPGEKAVAEWTNPAGKVIKNHGMAKKLENQEKKAARMEASKTTTAATSTAKTSATSTDANKTTTATSATATSASDNTSATVTTSKETTTAKTVTTTGEKAVAEWTNPSGKVIKNHGMARKMENQERKAARTAVTKTAADAIKTVSDTTKSAVTSKETDKITVDQANPVSEFKPQDANAGQ